MIYLKLLFELIVMLVFTYYIWEAVYMMHQEHKNLMNGKPRRTIFPDFVFIKKENKNKEYVWWIEFLYFSIVGLGCTYGVVMAIRNLINEIFL